MIANRNYSHNRGVRPDPSAGGYIGHSMGQASTTLEVDFRCDSCGCEVSSRGTGDEFADAALMISEEMVNRFGWSSFDNGNAHHCNVCSAAGDRVFEFRDPVTGDGGTHEVFSRHIPEPSLDTSALDEVEDLLKGGV